MSSISRNAAAEARGVPETDQLGGRVNRENSLTTRFIQGRRGGRRSRAKGDRIEREIVSRHADSSRRRPVPRSYPVLKSAASQFDYAAILPSLVPNLQAQAKLIKDMIAKTTAGLIEVGRNLIAVRAMKASRDRIGRDSIGSQERCCGKSRTAQARCYAALASAAVRLLHC
jgi:hypothetical protein